jgi:hypothetical protein
MAGLETVKALLNPNAPKPERLQGLVWLFRTVWLVQIPNLLLLWVFLPSMQVGDKVFWVLLGLWAFIWLSVEVYKRWRKPKIVLQVTLEGFLLGVALSLAIFAQRMDFSWGWFALLGLCSYGLGFWRLYQGLRGQ